MEGSHNIIGASAVTVRDCGIIDETTLLSIMESVAENGLTLVHVHPNN